MVITKGKQMRKALLLACAAALLAVVPVARAALAINGDIGFTGTYTQNGGTLDHLDTATSMSINTVSVQTAHGDLAGATGPSFISPIGVNGNGPFLVGNTLWTVTVGTDTYSFMVSTATQNFTTAAQLNLVGTGIVSTTKPGFDPTPGEWQLGFGATGDSFTWQSTAAAVPEPTTCLAGALMLLPFAASTIRSLRRKG